MARTFTSASSEYLGFTPQTWPSWAGGLTIAALLRRNATGVYHTIYSAGPTTGFSGDLTLGITSADDPYLEIGGTSRTLATTITAANQLIAVTKGNGTATPVAHFSVAPFTTWTHSNMSGTLANPSTTASTAEAVGRWTPASSDYFAGDIEWVGVWGFNMDNNTVESLPRMALPNLAHLFPLTFRFYWFNQPVSDNVRCLANSGADQTARTGTTHTNPVALMPNLGYAGSPLLSEFF